MKLIFGPPIIISALLFNIGCKRDNISSTTSKLDTNKVKLYHDSSYRVIYQDNRIAQKYAKMEYEAAQKLNYKKGIARGLLDLGNVDWISGNYPIALQTYLKALQQSEEIDNQSLKARCFLNMSNVYNDMNVFRDKNIFHKTIYYALMAERIDVKDRDTVRLILDYANLGEDYQKFNLDSALSYELKAFQLTTRARNHDYQGRIYYNLGSIYSKNTPDIARANFNHSIPLLEKVKDYHSLNQAYLGISNLLRKQKNSDSAAYFADKALKAAWQGKYPLGLLNADQLIYEFYKQHSNRDSSLKYLESKNITQDTIFNVEKALKFQDITFGEQSRQQTLKEDSKRRQKILQFAGIGAFMPLFFLIMLMLAHIRVKPRLIESLGIVGLLLFFEFLTLLLHDYLATLTDEKPIYMLPLLAGIASVLLPFHHKMQKWLKNRLMRAKKRDPGDQ